MNNSTAQILSYGMITMSQIDQNMEDWKDRIRKKWQESKNYPRKKKKRVRKELLIDWSIANWNPSFSF
jgi:hypothetical protein